MKRQGLISVSEEEKLSFSIEPSSSCLTIWGWVSRSPWSETRHTSNLQSLTALFFFILNASWLMGHDKAEGQGEKSFIKRHGNKLHSWNGLNCWTCSLCFLTLDCRSPSTSVYRTIWRTRITRICLTLGWVYHITMIGNNSYSRTSLPSGGAIELWAWPTQNLTMSVYVK